MTPVLVVGESLIDLVRRPDGTESTHPGGSPMNVAVGLARLGVDVWFQTAVGADPFGAQIRDHLTANRVAFSEAESVIDSPTGVARADLDDNGAASYTFDITWSPRQLAIGEAGSLHVGSIATILEPGADATLELVRSVSGAVVVTFDPNIRPTITPDVYAVRRRVEDLVACAHLVKASDDDVSFLYPGVPLARVAAQWQMLGARTVVITRGAAGCIGWAGGTVVELPAPPVKVADTIGAGDSFMAGLIAGMKQHDLAQEPERLAAPGVLSELLRFAAACAAVTVSRYGADPPHLDEMLLPTSPGQSGHEEIDERPSAS